MGTFDEFQNLFAYVDSTVLENKGQKILMVSTHGLSFLCGLKAGGGSENTDGHSKASTIFPYIKVCIYVYNKTVGALKTYVIDYPL